MPPAPSSFPDGGILVDSVVFNTVKHHFAMHAAGLLAHTHVQPIYRLVAQIHQSGGEWMYEMRDNQFFSHYDDFNQGWLLASQGSYAQGMDLLTPYLKNTDGPRVAPYLTWLVRALLSEQGNDLLPTELSELLAVLPERGPSLTPLPVDM
eukprot:NODE_5594_length_635_cov_13.474409_g5430_i0.p1 GENE.NODE_5594_length_635_cov_13.474409_g5430_i0~~NODE_5594_length_635_cov_13.474409_g5430_i0.p1  ORF type:complete len:150 (+),score=32.71 NODE_5594_length_635_cov_13.474409_g5430_i0:169-618(+)